MAEAKNIRLYTPGGERISDPELAADYLTADRTGPFRVGQKALYYRDGGLRRYCIPLDQIDHAFTRGRGLCDACMLRQDGSEHFPSRCLPRGEGARRGVHRDRELRGPCPGPAQGPHPQGLKLGYTPPAQ